MRFVAEHRDRFGVEPILRVLEIPPSTFYGWVARQRRPSPYQIEEVWLGELTVPAAPPSLRSRWGPHWRSVVLDAPGPR